MPLAGNNVICNAHFKKDWAGATGLPRVRCHLNQAGKKKSRRVTRAKVRVCCCAGLAPMHALDPW